MIPAVPPVDFPVLIERERRALLELLETLRPDDWGRPSPCPGWSVLDLASHILGVDLGVLARDRDGYHGTPVPADVDTEEAFVGFIDGLNDLWVDAARRLSPRLVIDLLRWAGPRLVDLYAGQDPTEVEAYVSWASDEPVPKWLDQGRELTERWVHHQQIRAAVGQGSRMEPEMTGAVLDVFHWAYSHRLAALARPPGTTAEVAITGAVSRRWRFVSDGRRWRPAEPADSPAPAAALEMDAETAWRLLSGGLGSDRLPAPVRNEDPELARLLLRTRAVIVLPAPDGG